MKRKTKPIAEDDVEKLKASAERLKLWTAIVGFASQVLRLFF